MRISERAQRMEPSITLKVAARTRELREKGHEVIGFTVGEPDFDTPAHIKAAAAEALARGATKYTAVAGVSELRAAVAEDLSRVHGVSIAPEEVMVSSGAKQSLFNLFHILLDPGDEIIVPMPCWPSHVELARMAGGTPVLLPQRLEDGFVIDADVLAAHLTPRTRVVLLSSPTNPTGAVYDEAALQRVAEVLRPAVRKNPDLMIVTDDLYRRLVYAPARFCSILRVAPDLAKNVILVDGVSKSYAMTGWRIGFVAAPRPLIEAMDGLQGQVTTNAAAVSQHAAVAAITGDQVPVQAMINEFDRRRQVMSAALKAMPGVTLCEPRGAFYCFADFSRYLQPHGGLANDVALLDYLMSEAGVAAIPGSGFFAPGFLRFSYATSLAQIEEGMRRLDRGLARLRGA